MSPGADEPVASFLEWDSSFFGFRIGRVTAARLTAPALAEILRWGAAEQIRCLYLAADGQSAETLALAAQGGFQFVDVRLELGCRLEAAPHAPAPADIIRAARPGDLSALQRIARGAHHDTRFFKDRAFPAARAADLYAEWIRRDLQLHTVFVADLGGSSAVGYITCQIELATKTGRIGLLAVDSGCARRGAGGALVRAALAWFGAQGCPEVKVVTQVSNIPAQCLYQAVGFRSLESSVWFHRWFPLPGQ